MKKLQFNKYMVFALLWFAVCWFGILRESTDNAPPPFPYFDKVAHCGMFFAQIWLFSRSFLADKKNIPYIGLMVFTLAFAVCSELAQLWFTQTRSAEVADGLADVLGAILALLLAGNATANQRRS